MPHLKQKKNIVIIDNPTLYKTQVCTTEYKNKKACPRGINCRLFHSDEEKRPVKMSFEEFMVNHRARNPDYDFQTREVLIEHPERYKLSMCLKNKKKQCFRGLSCWNYHGVEEKRPKNMPFEEYMV